MSKFPLSYTHDLSFWVNQEIHFDKLKFFSLVRNIAGLVLEAVQLIDTYKDACTGCDSLCYRLVYRSLDRALSKDQAAQIQLAVREAVRGQMDVKLR